MLIRDQTGRSFELQQAPRRIVSLVPSISELLWDLGLKDQLVGVTKFCVHPPLLRKTKTIVGGTKKLRQEVIKQLRPDLIVANKEENTREDVLQLAQNFPVFVSDVSNVNDSRNLITQLGKATGADEPGRELRENLDRSLDKVVKNNPLTKPVSALYLIWRKPYMAAGTDTYISQLMQQLNLKNVLEKRGSSGLRYPQLREEELIDLNPEVIILSTEPYPFKQTDATALTEKWKLPVVLADGEIFSWYGSRLIHSGDQLLQFLQNLNLKRG